MCCCEWEREREEDEVVVGDRVDILYLGVCLETGKTAAIAN